MYHLIKDIVDYCKNENMEFWQVVQAADIRERAVSTQESYNSMEALYEAMKLADSGYRAELSSASGLVGGDGQKLHIYNIDGKIYAEILLG